MNRHEPGRDAKFWTARRDTRWDVYHGREPLQVVAHDWYGFYEFSEKLGTWFKTPTSFVLQQEITRAEAESAAFRATVTLEVQS